MVHAMRVTRTASKDGTTIACVVSGSGPPLVVVHGTSGDATRWSAVIEALGEHFTVHAMHRRGRGESTDAEPYAIEREAEDIVAVVESLGSRVALLGHSFGAMCSLEALLRTRAVARVMLYEPPLPSGSPVYPAGLADKIEALLAAGDREGAVTTYFRDVFLLTPPALAMVRGMPSWQARVDAAHTLPREIRATDRWIWDPARFASVDVPSRVLVGGASIPIVQEMMRTLAAGLPGTELVALPGQQHVAMDTAPSLFVREVVAFLGR